MMKENAEIHYHSELMQNYVSNIPVGAGKSFKAIKDDKQKPLIFAIGTDDKLRLICQGEDQTAPWVLVDLSAEDVKTFDVIQDTNKGDIRIAYATNHDGEAKLYYTELSLNQCKGITQGAAPNWLEQPIDVDIKSISHIALNNDYLMFSAKYENRNAQYYFARYGDACTSFRLPQSASNIIDFKLGHFYGSPGAFLLCQFGDEHSLTDTSQNLLFQSFPDPEFDGKTLNVEYHTQGKLQSFCLLRVDSNNDTIITAGDEVAIFESPSKRTVLIDNRKSRFLDVQACRYQSTDTLWVVEQLADQGHQLLLLTNNFFDEIINAYTPGKWSSDIVMHENITQFTCIKGSENGNDLFLIDHKNQLSAFCQNPITTLWNETPLAVNSIDDDDALIQFDCYTGTISLNDPVTFAAVAEKEVHVTASSPADVIINGVSYSLSEDKPVKVKSDATGTVTVIYTVEDEINCPLFHFSYDEDRHVINPSHKLEERLRAVKNGTDFIDARTDDNQPLWNQGAQPPKSDLNNAALAMQQLLDSRQDFLNKAQQDTNRKNSSRQQGQHAVWGLSFENDAVTYLNPASARLQYDSLILRHQNQTTTQGKNSFKPIRWIGHTFGSIINLVSRGIGKITGFIINVIDGITNVILEIAGQVFRFIIDVIEKVFPFIKVIFDAIKLVFKTVLKWIGKLIGWDDIWDTHKVLARMLEHSLQSNTDYVRHNLSNWKKEIHNTLNKLRIDKQQFQSNCIPKTITAEEQRSAYSSPENAAALAPDANWSMYQLQHGGIATIGGTQGDGDFDKFISSIMDSFTFIDDIISEEIVAIVNFIIKPDFSVQGLLKLIEPIYDAIIDAIEAFLVGALDFIVGFMEKAEGWLTKRVKIPLISGLYKMLTGLLSEGEGEELTFINAVSLMVAIPYTITYKIFNGWRAPFADGTYGMDEKSFYDHLLEGRALPRESNILLAKGTGFETVETVETERHAYSAIGGTIGSFSGMIASTLGTFKSVGAPVDKWLLGFNLLSLAGTIPLPKDDTQAAMDANSIRMTQYLFSLMNTMTAPMYRAPNAAATIGFAINVINLGLNISANIVKNPGVGTWVLHMATRSGALVAGVGAISKNPIPIFIGAGTLYITGNSGFIMAMASDEKIHQHGIYIA